MRKGEAEFRADKNAPISDAHQGAHPSEVEPQVAREQLSRTRKEWGQEEGATGSVTRPLERERIAQEGATDDATVERIMRGLMSSDKFAKELEAAKGSRQTLVNTYRESIDAHQRITQGRNAADMSAGEYLKELLEEHFKETNSNLSKNIFENFDNEIFNFVQVCPKEMIDKLENPISFKEFKTNLA